jgi:hypothetical protein
MGGFAINRLCPIHALPRRQVRPPPRSGPLAAHPRSTVFVGRVYELAALRIPHGSGDLDPFSEVFEIAG